MLYYVTVFFFFDVFIFISDLIRCGREHVYINNSLVYNFYMIALGKYFQEFT